MTLKAITPADEVRLSGVIKESEESGERYLKELIDFIYKNIDDYETFQESDVYVDPEGTSTDFDQRNNGIVSF